MEDRELLELAAKAACLSGYIYEWVNGPEFIIPGEEPIRWNPLTDDGDALRLAMKLRITIEQDLLDTMVFAYVLIGSRRANLVAVSGKVTREESTRRAIVRAAAEIGKQMP